VKQSRATSLVKSLVSTAVGFGVAYVANMIILPLFGLPISHSANLLLTSIYTVISVARGYAIERFYEALGWRTRMSAFALAVLAERKAHFEREGYSTDHDDALPAFSLLTAGLAKAEEVIGQHGRTSKSLLRRRLVEAASLFIAEGERFDRLKPRKTLP
jgi:hypothetical protein